MRTVRVQMDILLSEIPEAERAQIAAMMGIRLEELDDLRGVTDDDVTDVLENGMVAAKLFEAADSEAMARIESVTVKTVEWV